jgi:NAD(P)-dependent dehydrogenase (short-subunit alcohol dehydrogenase family)
MSTRIFITGASRGIGLELARQYVAEGAQVFAAARAPGAADALQRLAAERGGRLLPVALDVTDEGGLRAAVDMVAREAGGLDVLINNAGINPRSIGLGAYTGRAMLEALHINAVAPVLIGQAFLDLLRRGQEPKLVNMSSQVGSFRWNQSGMAPVYAASKAALNMYTRAFAREAAGIITVAVHPGWVKTDMGGGGAPLLVDEAVRRLRALIGRLTQSDNGQFLNYDGQPHPW